MAATNKTPPTLTTIPQELLERIVHLACPKVNKYEDFLEFVKNFHINKHIYDTAIKTFFLHHVMHIDLNIHHGDLVLDRVARYGLSRMTEIWATLADFMEVQVGRWAAGLLSTNFMQQIRHIVIKLHWTPRRDRWTTLHDEAKVIMTLLRDVQTVKIQLVLEHIGTNGSVAQMKVDRHKLKIALLTRLKARNPKWRDIEIHMVIAAKVEKGQGYEVVAFSSSGCSKST